MEIKTVEELSEFIENNSVEEGMKAVKEMNPETFSSLKKLISYERKFQEGMRDTNHAQWSIYLSAFALLAAGCFGVLVSWLYQDKIHALIVEYKILVLVFGAYFFMGNVNVYDALKDYSWLNLVFDENTRLFRNDIRELTERKKRIYEGVEEVAEAAEEDEIEDEIALEKENVEEETKKISSN